MDINSIGSINSFAGIYGSGMKPPGNGNENPCMRAESIENMDISRPGKMMSAVSQMSEEEKVEAKAFHEEVMQAVQNGTFDSSEMAASAPEFLVKFAEENGLDLEQLVEGMSQGPPMHKSAPPPPPMMYNASGNGLSFDNQEESDLLSGLLFSDDSDEVAQV